MPLQSSFFVLLLLTLGCLLTGCASDQAGVPEPSEGSSAGSDSVASSDTSAGGEKAPVQTGAAVLARQDFRPLDGKRVGLVVNHTARVDTAHLIDLMDRAAGVEVAALFGPEHGLRGAAAAGEAVRDGRDEQSGAPVYSLYGDSRKPSPEALAGLDALVFDIQGVGARFYTYISTMGLAMQAAAEAGLPFFVLDRPNPLGGTYVSGFVMDEAQQSFVGKYPVPMAYGLTVGELARMIQGEELLPGLDRLDLHVIEMQGWQRPMHWPATGLSWHPPSPNIPDVETAHVYAGAVLFEATSASEGRGTDHPFKLIGAPWADGQALADTLESYDLPGVRFEPARFTPQPGEGAPDPKLAGQTLEGIRHEVTDLEAFRPVETGIHVLHAFYHQARRRDIEGFIERPEWLAKLAGTTRLGVLLGDGASPEAIIEAWQQEVASFRQRRGAYLLYE